MKLPGSPISFVFSTHRNMRFLIVTVILLLPIVTQAQFEKKISVNFTPGLFKTIGPKEYPDPYDPGYDYPFIMPNFQTGWILNGGVQFNYSRKVSFEVNLGFARSGFWNYDAYDPDYDDYYCWTCWEIYDEFTDEPVASGQDYYTLVNFSVGFAPKFYFLPSKKINPYGLLEVNLNYTSVDFIDAEYEEYVKLGREDEYGESASETWFEKSFGFGFNPMIGAEYTLSDAIGIYLQAGYWLIILNKKELYIPEEKENFNALKFQIGVRMSFWKAKEL